MTQDPWYRFHFRNPARQMAYYAIAQCGEGRFGKVWAGFDGAMVPVALKIVKPTSDSLRDLLRWHNEQNIFLQCLLHPHIVTTYDQFCCDDGTLVIVMELAEGSLADYLGRSGGKLHPILVCSVGIPGRECSRAHSFNRCGTPRYNFEECALLWQRSLEALGLWDLDKTGLARRVRKDFRWIMELDSAGTFTRRIFELPVRYLPARSGATYIVDGRTSYPRQHFASRHLQDD